MPFAKQLVYYKLADDEETPVPVIPTDAYGGITDICKWLMSRPQDQGGLPQAAFDLLPNGGHISTIFLVLSIMDPPVLWETMAFSGTGEVLLQERFVTKSEALEFHQCALKSLTVKSAADTSSSLLGQ